MMYLVWGWSQSGCTHKESCHLWASYIVTTMIYPDQWLLKIAWVGLWIINMNWLNSLLQFWMSVQILSTLPLFQQPVRFESKTIKSYYIKTNPSKLFFDLILGGPLHVCSKSGMRMWKNSKSGSSNLILSLNNSVLRALDTIIWANASRMSSPRQTHWPLLAFDCS